jgi:hypothetical protein
MTNERRERELKFQKDYNLVETRVRKEIGLVVREQKDLSKQVE